MIKTLKLYKPHKRQIEFHNCTKRFRVAACGRQFGKSIMCLMEIVKKAWENPKTIYWYISPTNRQAAVQFRKLLDFFTNSGIIRYENNSKLVVELINGSIIQFLSGESKHHLRGDTLHGVVIDEYRDQPQELWSMIVRPMLSVTNGWAAIISTPNGYDDFYELANMHLINDDWAFIQAPLTSSPLVSPKEIENLRATMHPDHFAQEIMAEFRDLTRGKVYTHFGGENVVEEYTIDKTLPVIVSMDFNINPMAWVIGQKLKDEWIFFEEIFLEESTTQDASIYLINVLKSYGVNNIIITGDPSGNSRQRAAYGLSDYDIVFEELSKNGIVFRSLVPNAHDLVKDRVNMVNSFIMNSKGERRLKVLKKMKNTIKDFNRCVWKKNGNEIDKTDKMITHLTDAIGYAVTQYKKEDGLYLYSIKVINKKNESRFF